MKQNKPLCVNTLISPCFSVLLYTFSRYHFFLVSWRTAVTATERHAGRQAPDFPSTSSSLLFTVQNPFVDLAMCYDYIPELIGRGSPLHIHSCPGCLPHFFPLWIPVPIFYDYPMYFNLTNILWGAVTSCTLMNFLILPRVWYDVPTVRSHCFRIMDNNKPWRGNVKTSLPRFRPDRSVPWATKIYTRIEAASNDQVFMNIPRGSTFDSVNSDNSKS